jgi:hypothetical protein
MKCDGVRHLLSAYLDGEVARGEKLMVEQHLRRCPACADEANALRQTIALCASLDEVDVPADFRAGLRARLVALGPPAAAVTPAARPAAWRKARWALPAVAAAAAFAMAVGVGPYVADQIVPAEKPPSFNVSVPFLPQTAEVGSTGGGQTAGQPQENQTGPTTGSPGTQSGETTNPNGTTSSSGDTNTTSVTAVDPQGGDAQVAHHDNRTGTVMTALAPKLSLSAALHLRVFDLQAALERVQATAASFGGSVTAGSFDRANRSYSNIHVSVPAARMAEFMTELVRMGILVEGGTIASQDVALEMAQTEATMLQAEKDLQAVQGTDAQANAARESLRERIAKNAEQLRAYQLRVNVGLVVLTLEEMRQSSMLH